MGYNNQEYYDYLCSLTNESIQKIILTKAKKYEVNIIKNYELDNIKNLKRGQLFSIALGFKEYEEKLKKELLEQALKEEYYAKKYNEEQQRFLNSNESEIEEDEDIILPGDIYDRYTEVELEGFIITRKNELIKENEKEAKAKAKLKFQRILKEEQEDREFADGKVH